MKILIIGKVWPEPQSSAAGSRTLQMIASLRGFELHFACAAQPGKHSHDFSASSSVTTHSIAVNDSAFDKWIRRLEPDAVIYDRYMTEEQFGWRVAMQCPKTLRIIDTSDLHFLRAARQESLRTGSSLDLKNETALREVAAILRSDLSLVISEYERDLLLREFPVPNASIAYWPFALGEPGFPLPSFGKRDGFVMIGSFLHEPNWDAVQWCREKIWPAIRAELPDASLHVYGSYAPRKALQLDNPSQGFRVLGRARDAIETLKQRRVNLAPLRFGAGLKGKIADAFLAGTPNVATPIAVEGFPGDLDWGCEISDDPIQFAQAAVQLYRDKESWKRAQICGFQIAKRRFSKEDWFPRLPRIIETAHAHIAEIRASNFVGRMLNHHHHRSTEFMSRWIEEKNKRGQ